MVELDRRLDAPVGEHVTADAARALLRRDDPLPLLRARHLATVAALASGELGRLRVRLRFVSHRVRLARCWRASALPMRSRLSKNRWLQSPLRSYSRRSKSLARIVRPQRVQMIFRPSIMLPSPHA